MCFRLLKLDTLRSLPRPGPAYFAQEKLSFLAPPCSELLDALQVHPFTKVLAFTSLHTLLFVRLTSDIPGLTAFAL